MNPDFKQLLRVTKAKTELRYKTTCPCELEISQGEKCALRTSFGVVGTDANLDPHSLPGFLNFKMANKTVCEIVLLLRLASRKPYGGL
jgi:hypothetical protein